MGKFILALSGLAMASASSIFQNERTSNQFLRVKRSPQCIFGFGPDCGKTASPNYSSNCRSLSETERLILRNVNIAEQQKLYCGETWEHYTDFLEKRQDSKIPGYRKGIPRKEYARLNKCVRKCNGIGSKGRCKKAKKAYKVEVNKWMDQVAGQARPKMPVLCQNCVKHIPKSYKSDTRFFKKFGEDASNKFMNTVIQQATGVSVSGGLVGDAKNLIDGLLKPKSNTVCVDLDCIPTEVCNQGDYKYAYAANYFDRYNKGSDYESFFDQF